jgi:hypothetical protein
MVALEMVAHLAIAVMRGAAASDEAEERRDVVLPLAHAVVGGRMGRFI